MGKRWINTKDHCNDCHLINGKWFHLAGNLLWEAHEKVKSDDMVTVGS